MDKTMHLVICPTCKQESTEADWNTKTTEVVRCLNGDENMPITLYNERQEGTYFRCPKCEDELITDFNKELRTQDEDGTPLITNI